MGGAHGQGREQDESASRRPLNPHAVYDEGTTTVLVGRGWGGGSKGQAQPHQRPRVAPAGRRGAHSGRLLSTAEIGVVIREEAKPGIVVLPWSAEGDRWGFVGPNRRLGALAICREAPLRALSVLGADDDCPLTV